MAATAGTAVTAADARVEAQIYHPGRCHGSRGQGGSADLPPRNASLVETQFETKVETKADVAARCQIEFKASLKWRKQVRNEYDIESAWSKPVRNGCDIEFATGVVTAAVVVVVVVAEAGFAFCHAAGEGGRVTAEGDGRVTAEGEWGAGSQGSGSSQAEPEPEF